MIDSYFYTLYAVTTFVIVMEWLGVFCHKAWLKYLLAGARTVFYAGIVFSVYTMSSNVGEFAVAVWTQLQQLAFMVMRGS